MEVPWGRLHRKIVPLWIDGHASEGFHELTQSHDARGSSVTLRQLAHALLDERERAETKREDGPVRQLLERRDDDRPRRLEIRWIEPNGRTRGLGRSTHLS